MVYKIKDFMWNVDPSGLVCAHYMIWMVNWATLIILATGNNNVYKSAQWHFYESGFNFYCIEYTYCCYFNHASGAVYAMGNTRWKFEILRN